MTATLDIAAEHAGLVAQLRAAGRPDRGGGSGQNDSYSSSGHPFFDASIPDLRRLARSWLSAHRKAPDGDIVALADRLFRGAAYEEKVEGALLLGYSPRARRAASPAMVEAWLGELAGWAEIDSLCASVFGPAELLADWPGWRSLIERLARDPNINKRRAALVLLTPAVRKSDDPRFGELAVAVVDRLKAERPILITKAVSWLLRAMCVRHADVVEAYLAANERSLPAIAVRETRTKLRTGTKSGRSQRRP